MAVRVSRGFFTTREPLWLGCFFAMGAAIPLEGACYPAQARGIVGSIWYLVSLLWALQRMAWSFSGFFGTYRSFSLEGLSWPFFTWPTVFVLKGSDQLSLPTAVPLCHSHLLARCPSSGSHRPWLPTADANQTGVSYYLLAFLSCGPNTASGMWHGAGPR